VPALDMTNTKSLIYRKVVTVKEVTSRPSMSAVERRDRERRRLANFLALQSQLESTENSISVSRRGYIDAVRAYNLSLRTFPTLLWAKTFFLGNKPMAEFAASEGSEKPPQVKF
jgi:LemA family